MKVKNTVGGGGPHMIECLAVHLDHPPQVAMQVAVQHNHFGICTVPPWRWDPACLHTRMDTPF